MPDIFHLAIWSNSPWFRDALSRQLVPIVDTSVHLLEPGDTERLRATRMDMVVVDGSGDALTALAFVEAVRRGNEEQIWSVPVSLLLISPFTPAFVPVLASLIGQPYFSNILAPDDPSPKTMESPVRHAAAIVVSAIARQRGESASRILRRSRGETEPATTVRMRRREPADAIVIGSSTGGPQALAFLLPKLCQLTTRPILVVQHIQQSFTQPLALSLNAKCDADVSEATHDGVLEDGHIYLAPGGTHLSVRHTASGVRLCLSHEAPELGCRPSVNVLFRSAADVFGSRVVAAVLTGMGCDGAEGALVLRAAGARVLAQDEASSVVWGMPGSAVAAGAVVGIHALNDLPREIAAAANGSEG